MRTFPWLHSKAPFYCCYKGVNHWNRLFYHIQNLFWSVERHSGEPGERWEIDKLKTISAKKKHHVAIVNTATV